MKKGKLRSFTSASMLILIIILTVTGIIIETIEIACGKDETASPFLVAMFHVTTAVHVLTGFVFAILSFIHIVLNWKALKKYFKKNKH